MDVLDLFKNYCHGSWELGPEVCYRASKRNKKIKFVKDNKERADITLDISESELRLSPNAGISGQVENIRYFFTEI